MSPTTASRYDVVVVGASLAGCTAATLFARRGLRVALVERHAEPNAYKKICTHFIQPSATPTLVRLGLAAHIEAAGGMRNALEVWTRWGWIRTVPDPAEGEAPYGYSLRRETLDPMVRRLAAEEPRVELLLGVTACGLRREADGGRAVEVERRDGRRQLLAGRLVVAADGRHSRMAELAGVPARVRRNERFMYFAYYRDLPLASGTRGQLR